jgi:hypothetical protein
MTQKEYLLQLLAKLYPTWTLAESFTNIIRNIEVDDAMIQTIM